jgi:hypothetical protein
MKLFCPSSQLSNGLTGIAYLDLEMSLFYSADMNAININILYFLCFDAVYVNDRLGFGGCNIDFENNPVLIDLHITNVLIFVIFFGDTDVVKYNILGVRMLETQDDFVLIIHTDNFPRLFKGHVRTLIFPFIK